MNNQVQEFRLLPRFFKGVAFALFLATPFICYLIGMIPGLNIEGSEVVTALKSMGLVSSLIFIMSREKEEDELMMRIRLKAFSFSFLWVVTYVAIQPFANAAFEGSFVFDNQWEGVIFSMLLVYLLMFYYLKWKR